ncbi:MAG TPA: glycogen-binding domain-containing protein [Gemmatimonadales bacterium]|jgi:hypothetical protein
MTALRVVYVVGVMAAGVAVPGAAQVGSSLGAAVRSPPLGPVHGEITGQADWIWSHRIADAAVVTGDARIYAATSAGTALWFGRGVGAGWTLGRRRPLDRTMMGATARWGRVRFGLSINSTIFDPMPAAGGGETTDTLNLVRADTGRSERRTAYTDASVASGWSMAGVQLDLSIGRRFSKTIPEVLLWGVTASRPVAPGIALLASIGRSGTDPVTALPGSRYFSLGIRLSAGGGSEPARESRSKATALSAFRIGPPRLTGREVVVQAPEAKLVELAGDFTDWRPVELEAGPGGIWRTVLPIAPGIHRISVRMDGGPWQAPPGIRPAASEFGAEVGEVMVE